MSDHRLGAWVRAENVVGLVAALEGDEISVFDPTARVVTRVPSASASPLPAGAVTITVSVDVPLPHGLEEDGVSRWIGSLVDPVVRERALEALREAGLDEGAALPPARVSVDPAAGGGAVCLAGHRTPAPDGASMACPGCGREAVARPLSDGSAGLAG